jgi:sarcosine oxidase subunit alpha
LKESRSFSIRVDGREIPARAGMSVAAALWNAGIRKFRRSAGGEARGPLCAMGICFECRVTIDGVAHRRSCLETCRPELEVETDD